MERFFHGRYHLFRPSITLRVHPATQPIPLLSEDRTRISCTRLQGPPPFLGYCRRPACGGQPPALAVSAGCDVRRCHPSCRACDSCACAPWPDHPSCGVHDGDRGDACRHRIPHGPYRGRGGDLLHGASSCRTGLLLDLLCGVPLCDGHPEMTSKLLEKFKEMIQSDSPSCGRVARGNRRLSRVRRLHGARRRIRVSFRIHPSCGCCVHLWYCGLYGARLFRRTTTEVIRIVMVSKGNVCLP